MRKQGILSLSEGQNVSQFTTDRTNNVIRFLWFDLPLYFTERNVVSELKRHNLKILFVNMKVCRSFSKDNSRILEKESNFPSFDKVCENIVFGTSISDNITSEQITFSNSCQCYIEILCLPNEAYKPEILLQSHPLKILSNNDSILPTAKNCGYKWYPDIMRHILSYFHSPLPMISQEHRINSYNVLLSYIFKQKKCYFAAFENHLHFAKLLVETSADNVILLTSNWLENKEVMMAAVKQQGKLLLHAGNRLKSDKQIALIAVKQDYENFSIISSSLTSDLDIIYCYLVGKQQHHRHDTVLKSTDKRIQVKNLVLELVKINPRNLNYATQQLKADKDVVLAAVTNDPLCLVYADDSLQNNPEVVIAAMKNCRAIHNFFNILSESMKNCKSVVLPIVEKCPILFLSLSYEMQDDADIVRTVLSKNGRLFEYVSEDMKNSKEMALLALTDYVDVFPLLSEQLRDDRDIVMLVIEKNAALFKHASDNLRNDKYLALMAVKQHPVVFRDISFQLKNDSELAVIALNYQIELFDYLGEKLKDTKDFVLAVLDNYPQLFPLVSSRLKSDKEVVLKALQKDGLLLQYASKELRNDEHIVMTAITNNIKASDYIGDELRCDKSVLLKLLRLNIETATMPIPNNLKSDKEFMTTLRNSALDLISQRGYFLGSIDPKFAKEEAFIRAAVNQNPMNLKYVKGPLTEDFEFIYQVLQVNGYAIQFVSEELLVYDDIITVAKESILKQLIAFKSLNALADLPAVLLRDRDFILQIVRVDGLQLANVLPEFKREKEIIFAAIQSNAAAFKFVPQFILEDASFVQEAIKVISNPSVEFTTTLANDFIFMKGLIEKDGYAIQLASQQLQQYLELVQLAKKSIISQIPNTSIQNRFDRLPPSFLKDKQFVLNVLEKDGLQLQFVPAHFENDKDSVITAVSSNTEALQYVSEQLKESFQQLNCTQKGNEQKCPAPSNTLKSGTKTKFFNFKFLKKK